MDCAATSCGKPVSLGVNYRKDAGAVQSFIPCVLPAGHEGPCEWDERSESSAAHTEYQRIDFTPEDAQAVYRVLIAARALDGVMFTHDEWDEAMSAFGRACIVAGAKKARAAS